jgi:CheY-like chemotaxis protein
MMLTSLADAGQLQRCHELGITAVLTKPVMRPELLEAVVGVLRGNRMGRMKPSLAAPELAARSLQILLAEDNAVNQMVAVGILGKRGHVVRIAANGRAAVEAFRAERFDLILMDVQMPVMGGYEATAAIRALEKTAGAGGHIPIVALTAHAMKGDRELCLAAGMDGYLTKPTKPLALIHEVERLAAGTAAAVAPVPVPDDSSLLERFLGDAELLYSVAEVFLESEPGLRAEVARALASRDSNQVSRWAHTIKGSVGNFGAARAMGLAGELEILGRDDNLAPAGKVFAALVEALDGLRAQLDRIVQAHGKGTVQAALTAESPAT